MRADAPADSADFEAVFQAHYRRVARVIFRVIQDPSRAEELAVEVFWKLWRRSSDHGPHSAGWLYRSAGRAALDELRKRVRREKYEQWFGVKASSNDPETIREAAEERVNPSEGSTSNVMEKPDPLDRWVHLRMTASAPPPAWPDPVTARRLLARRTEKTPRSLWLWAGATAALCVVLALPSSRAVAQRLWDQMVLGRIQVLSMDLDDAGAAASFFSPVMQQRPELRPVESLEDASRLAGFSPRLPAAGVFAGSPSYSVADMISAKLQLRTPAIRFLIARAGGSASDVPDSWDGVVLEVVVGPLIAADYDGVLLLQSLPFRLNTPADFDLERFYRVAFRALGMSEQHARDLGADLGISPAFLTFMPKEERDLLTEFRTSTGSGMMIEEVYGPGKIAALWSGSDRLYALFPNKGEISKEFVIKVATAVE